MLERFLGCVKGHPRHGWRDQFQIRVLVPSVFQAIPAGWISFQIMSTNIIESVFMFLRKDQAQKGGASFEAGYVWLGGIAEVETGFLISCLCGLCVSFAEPGEQRSFVLKVHWRQCDSLPFGALPWLSNTGSAW